MKDGSDLNPECLHEYGIRVGTPDLLGGYMIPSFLAMTR